MMRELVASSILLFLLFTASGFKHAASANSIEASSVITHQDTVSGNQLLYNGRVWKNIYYYVAGDQFLFSPEFAPGSVTMRGKPFGNLMLRYDICSDEIMIITASDNILQLNKEMVDGFTVSFDNHIHRFIRIDPDSINNREGYFDVLYDGNTSLLVKYSKKVTRSNEGKRFETFVQYNQVYILKDGYMNRITGKKDIYNLFGDSKKQVRIFMKNNRIRIVKKTPQSYIRVLEYFDSLNPG